MTTDRREVPSAHPGDRPRGAQLRDRRTAPRRGRRPPHAPTTGTSPPTTSSTAPRRSCTARWPRTTAPPSRAPRARASVHVFTPTLAEHGWSAGGHSVVEVVTDDMPFLVDSVVMELTRQQRDVHLVIHPQFDVDPRRHRAARADRLPRQRVRRAARGRRARVVDARRDQPDRPRRGRRRDRRTTSSGCCATSASPSRTGTGCAQQVGEIVERADGRPAAARSRPRSSSAAGAFLEWLADDHFTFLGYREYHLEREGDDEYLRGVPGTGLGILRNDPDMSSRVRQAAAEGRRAWPASTPCWCWPRPTPAPPCTARRTSTTSA